VGPAWSVKPARGSHHADAQKKTSKKKSVERTLEDDANFIMQRTLSKRSALYDADGDGKLSAVEEMMKKYDT
jgi:hypothetical protein